MSEPAPKKRSIVPFVLAAGAILSALPAGYLVLLREPPQPPHAPAGLDATTPAPAGPDAALDRLESLQIAELSGVVEVRHGQGPYALASLGTLLKPDDALRTGEGRARLVARDAFDIQVEPGTEVEFQELAARLGRLKLGLGMLVAKVDGKSGFRLEIGARGTDAVASSGEGTFAISSNGAGTVAVGVREGEVELRAAGKAVVLRTGQQSVAAAGGAPSDAATIPASLFLKVDWPSERETNHPQLALSGRTAPGAVLRVAGQSAVVEKDGRFHVVVRLREGRNAVAVEGADVGGHAAQNRRDLVVDTTAPDSDISTQKLWNP